MTQELSGHAGELAVAVARAHGVETMFTLSGAHVFPMYDGAVKAEPPMRLLDVGTSRRRRSPPRRPASSPAGPGSPC